MTSTDLSNDIAVIGMAGRFPGARDLNQFWRNLRDGVESITFFEDEQLLAHGVPQEHLDAPNYIRAASVLEDFDRFDAPFFGYNAREAAILDPQQRLFLENAWAALEDAGHTAAGFDGSIGVYAAANLSTYLMANLTAGRGLPPGGDSLELVIANDKDYVASRTAYKLDVDGPAVCVQTACSSSLTAVHTAAQALLGFECDMALAGGVTLRCPQHAGYFHREGMIFAADGHCRPFDSRASGTVAGNGVGTVVLKRLDDALADGDHIEAVIKGSAVNNDGAAKIGYTAPSVQGQAQVVAAALGVAEIDPATITAIEAHGTGTLLGDPIEVRALDEVFRTAGSAPADCALGSVKGNIGHLDSTAGVTGLIKAILQLRHCELAPSINFTEANPEIDFDATPLHVNTASRKWTSDVGPRRIGVSSFGIGGTNAHLVLEEAPTESASPQPQRDVQVVTLSARTGQALDEYSTALAEALEQGDRHELADVAHTLQTGRADFEHRRILVARDRADAADALRHADPGRVTTQTPTAEPRVVLLFPGQGTQYPNMGLQLYRTESVFRSCVDRCAELLTAELGFDLRDVLFPLERGATDTDEVAARLESTEIAQPALFTIEYALAELLQSWGVRADAMVGHSVGEITAACRAGVLGLNDALRLVAARGALMGNLPTGSMLSVGLPERQLRSRLPEGLALAAVNADELCVISGEHEDVAEFKRLMESEEVPTRELRTSHAFHSAMMEPILEPFAAELAELRFHPPQLPYTSNSTGQWVTADQATDPNYWVRHVRETVRFGDGIARASESGPTVMLEVGPGNTLGTLARACGLGSGHTIVPSLPGPGENPAEQEFLLHSLGRLWLAGYQLDWTALHPERRRRVALPTYPFEKRRYWIEPAHGTGPAGDPAADIEVADDTDNNDGLVLDTVDPRPAVSTDYEAPRDEREQHIARIWQDMLGVGPIGAHDPFVELGGHSLLAARVLARINTELGAEITPRALFETPTVAGLAATIAESSVTTGTHEVGLPAATVDPDNLYEPFPLTEIQQAQWIGRMGSFNVGDVAAHAYWEVDLDGIDLDKLEGAFNELLDRHTMLRAVIQSDGNQRILPDVGPYRFEKLDLRQQTDEQCESALDELRERLSHEVRDSSTWPLFDIRVSLLPQGGARLHLGFDLLIADIGSLRILMRDWRKIYQHGPDELAPLSLSFRDYALAASRIRETPLYQRSLTYWRERVRDLPAGPDLPLATAPASLTRTEFTARRAVVDRARWDAFVAHAARHGATASAALLAVYAHVLATWARDPRFTLNVTLTNRLEVHDEVSELVGEFASFDLLPVDLAGGPGIGAVARGLQEQAWQDLEYRYLNGVEILREMARRDGGTSGAAMPVVFTSTLVQQTEPGDESMFGWLGEMTHEIAQTPQVWMDAGVLEVAEGMQLSWHGVKQLFPAGVLDDMFEQFRDLVLALSEDESMFDRDPGALLPAHQRELIDTVNDTAGPVPRGLLFTPLVEQATRHPERVAVIEPDRELTFGELYRHACRIGRRLRELGVGPNQLVAVAADKSCEQLVAALGVLLAGGAYLPVDPDLPVERQDHLLEHGQTRIVLTRADGPDREWPEGVRGISVDLAVETPDEDAPEPVQQPDDLAYVIYTSGSTGNPKGVMLSHRAALNTLVDINERYAVGSDDRVLGLSSLSFDLSVWDVFGVLGAGGAVVLPEKEAGRSPDRWLRLVIEHRVTLWNSVPALMQMFADHLAGLKDPPHLPLRLALLSGDWIPIDLPDRLRAVGEGIEVISLGGATEAAVWSIHYPIGQVDRTWDSIPYGRPLRNQTVHVLDERLEECPVWTTGELYIGGTGVAEGYWRDPGRTAESFLTHPRSDRRLYRTGDLGRRLPDGDIEFLGREDFQVKIGGFRIELGEIESALLRCPGVHTAIAAAVGTDRHHRRLAAYLVPEAPAEQRDETTDQELSDLALRTVTDTLPNYMVPAAITVLDRLPLTANGKIDRNALPDPAAEDNEQEAETTTGPLAERLSSIIAESLGLDHVGANQNFFEIGGDSIKGIQIISLANAQGLEITPADLFQQPTIAALAAVLSERGVTAVDTDRARALTAHQHRIFERCPNEIPKGVHRLELDLDRGLTAQHGQQALTDLVQDHEALRQRFTRDDSGWSSTIVDTDPQACHLPPIDLAALPEQRREPAMRQMVAEMVDELDIVEGPLVKAALFDLGADSKRLVLLVHELAVDTVSWGTLTNELFPALRHDDHDDASDPSSSTDVSPRWPRPHLRQVEVTSASPHALDFDPSMSLSAADEPVQHIDGGLDEERTATLLDNAWKAYRMSPEEVCLAALVRAVGAETGGGPFVADVEYDLRDPDRARPEVGPYSGTAAVVVDLDDVTDVDSVLNRSKHGYRGGAGPAARCDETPETSILLRGVLRMSAQYADPDAEPPIPVCDSSLAVHPLILTPCLMANRLQLRLTTRIDEDTACRVSRALRQALVDIAEHCASPHAGGVSAADFPLADLDDAELAAFLTTFATDTNTDPASPTGGEEDE
ncbi:AMP-binding enzyme C-terminal domain-containing protein [Actinopolyspora mzabensis]|uniref:Phenyloxazoline synthase MbtB n=1 Tax=Actinopolyspora mzabensis TaxID=995066 RepID=A0A1G9EGH0_ACTMZ|nr:hybrid non-ribosomal peptide synthetase/type I polyketide synthase [Actinopolyspora mzabensis]SDK75250.1 AMP-binding enzyme C-terminal domain-containing protein [Actinopolyspora mzabensis]